MNKVFSFRVCFVFILYFTSGSFAAADQDQVWPLRSYNARGHFQAPVAFNVSNLRMQTYNLSSLPNEVGSVFYLPPFITNSGIWYMTYLWTASDGTVWIVLCAYDPLANEVIATFSGLPYPEIVMLANGTLIVIDSYDPTAVTMLDENLDVLNRIDFGQLVDFTWRSADSELLFVALCENQAEGALAVVAVNMTSASILWTFEVPAGKALSETMDSFTVSEDGSRLYAMIFGMDKDTMKVNVTALDVATGVQLWSSPVEDNCYTAMSWLSAPVSGCGDGSDGGLVVSLCNSGYLSVMNGTDGRLLWRWKYYKSYYGWEKPIVVCRDKGQSLLLACVVDPHDKKFLLWHVFDFATGKVAGPEQYIGFSGVADANGIIISLWYTDIPTFTPPLYLLATDPVTGDTLAKLPISDEGGWDTSDTPAITARGGYLNYLWMPNRLFWFEVISE
eukprot:TRINITY_DN1086_c0_g2_i2.p1 TRINITY_DN1086_c0_g2~~TRINITY_DN1086_c0_g2_i2.p1  ORF type:complete len:508 (-),score=-32.47 TRINITY_DN1086_c0_g2_i2:60-1400(-)